MNNPIARALAIVGASLALVSLGAAQSYRGDRSHNDRYNGGHRNAPPKSTDHGFLDLFRGRGHAEQDRRNHERQQHGYGYYGGYDNRGYGGYDNRGYDNRGYGGYDNRGYGGRNDRHDSRGRNDHGRRRGH